MKEKVIISLERQLWAAADKLRGNLDASSYKYVVLGLIFLKYISDTFEERHHELSNSAYQADAEERDFYLEKNVFWVPKEARWSYLRDNAKQPTIGVLVDAAMDAIELENPKLKGVLPKDYARESLDKRRLGELIDLVSSIELRDSASESDLLGKVYEYFLGQFASAEGKKGGEFFTPQSIVKLLVEMLEPNRGRIYDPCCGSGGMFVHSEEFVKSHQGRIGDIAIYGQELNHTTWQLANMNLAIRGISADIKRGDTLHEDRHPDLRADYILANPPFNISDWGGELMRTDPRWKFGIPPTGNANFAWVQHMVHHLAPNGTAGFVLSNGSLSSQTSGEGDIRKHIVEADLVDCIVMLPKQLFYNTGIPACMWFISRNRTNRSGKVLFIDASEVGFMEDRTHRAFTSGDIAKVAGVYHSWKQGEGYEDVKGFCKSVGLDDIRKHNHVLTPGRYVGIPDGPEDDEPYEEKIARLSAELRELLKEEEEVNGRMREELGKIGIQL